MLELISHHHWKRIIFTLLLLGALNGILFALIVPAWQAPDEPFYFQYTRILVEERRFPHPDETRAAGHPPLYPIVSVIPYLFGSPFGERAQLLLIRLMGVIFFLLVGWLGFKTAETIFPENRLIQALVPLLIVFNPQYAFIGASGNSDTLLILLSSLFLYQIVRLINPPVISLGTDLKSVPTKGEFSWQRAFLLGVNLAFGLLTKERFLIFIPPLFLAPTLLKIPPLSPPFPKGGVGGFLPPFSKVGRGEIFTPLLQRGVWGDFVFLFLHQSYGKPFAERMFEEFWGYFGWLQIPLSQSIYLALKVFIIASLFGLFLGMRRLWRSQRSVKVSLLLFSLTILLTFYAVSLYDITTNGGQGRYFFISIVPISFFLALGMRELFPARFQKVCLVLLFGGFFALNIISLFWYILPNYC